jgi:hypothetical protein
MKTKNGKVNLFTNTKNQFLPLFSKSLRRWGSLNGTRTNIVMINGIYSGKVRGKCINS